MIVEVIPFELVERQTSGAVRLGISYDKLLADSLITRRYGDDRDVVTPTQYLLLCVNTLLGVEDASHGLAKVGLGPSLPAIGLRMAFAYPNLGEALTALARFYQIASGGMRLNLGCNQATATLSVSIEAWSDQDSAHIEEIQLGWLFMNCLHFLGYPPPVSEVTLRNPSHFNLGQRHWAIGGPVRHGTTTAFTFPRCLLSAPPTSSGDARILWGCHRRWLDFLEVGPSERAISEYVNDGEIVRFSDIVRRSGKSANTVRHRLQAVNGGYRETRRRTLIQAATDRLIGTSDSVETIANDHGFSDARSFRRFLKNASGLTPQQIRRAGHVEQPGEDASALSRLKVLTEQLSI